MKQTPAASQPNTRLTDTLTADATGWRLTESGFDPDRAVAVGSNFLCGNGYLGYRGTTPEQGASEYVALVVTDTYDCADGHWRELTTAPNPLFVSAEREGRAFDAASAIANESSLDLASGTFRSRQEHEVGGGHVTIEVERFASNDQLPLLVQRWTLRTDTDLSVDVRAGIDCEVWSLNGQHLPAIDLTSASGIALAAGVTVESGVEIATASHATITRNGAPVANTAAGNIDQVVSIALADGDELVIETVAAVASSNDAAQPTVSVRALVEGGVAAGFDRLSEASAEVWRQVWDDIDVVIEGDLVSQVALRFSAYHNRICTPAHTDHLPIGARGLSCQAYQGSAFWDQEVFNLPAFLFTEPEIARNLLIYRHRTLDGARRKAARLGYDGAYYAWVSGVTGDELCPDVFFEDVLTGRPIRNHFNVWQMHVSPDVVTTIARYVEVTGDADFVVDYGAEIAFEVARFLRSFVRWNDWRGTYHCIRLLGPDEWHENVDDNAFTNYQTHAALAFAIATHEQMEVENPEAFAALVHRLELDPDEVERWRHVRDHLVLPAPGEDGLIEQFAGFFQLEDVSPAEVAKRLQHPDEYWGWPNGIAVATQVSKQADVAMLLWLHDHRFDDATIAKNYRHYEERCSHASSLSHAAHGMVALGIGDLEAALAHFRATATVDLLNTHHAVVAGTFIGGIHTAACGGTYQLVVNGFGGLDVVDEVLEVSPRLPAEWTELRFPVSWRGSRLDVSIDHEAVAVTASADNEAEAVMRVGGHLHRVEPGGSLRIPT